MYINDDSIFAINKRNGYLFQKDGLYKKEHELPYIAVYVNLQRS